MKCVFGLNLGDQRCSKERLFCLFFEKVFLPAAYSHAQSKKCLLKKLKAGVQLLFHGHKKQPWFLREGMQHEKNGALSGQTPNTHHLVPPLNDKLAALTSLSAVKARTIKENIGNWVRDQLYLSTPHVIR